MIKQATLDLLDSELRRDYDKYNNYPYDDRLKLFSHSIRIDPYWSIQMLKGVNEDAFKWSEPIKFSDNPKFEELIESNEKGLYLFIVRPNQTILDLPQYVIYVGISGEKGSNRALKDRLSDYQYISQLKKRKALHKMLQLYYNEVYIRYSLFEGEAEDLESLETVLHEYFNPLCNTRDFIPETKQAKRAWGH